MQHNRRKPRAGGTTARAPATGAAMNRVMARMSASAASGCTAKPVIYASGSTANGTRQSACGRKGGCARYKTEKPAPAAAKRKVETPACYRQRGVFHLIHHPDADAAIVRGAVIGRYD